MSAAAPMLMEEPAESAAVRATAIAPQIALAAGILAARTTPALTGPTLTQREMS